MFLLLTGPTLLDVVVDLLLEVEIWFLALCPALLVKLAVLLEVVSEAAALLLQLSLQGLPASQAAMTKLHAEEKDAFAINKRDLEDGIVAVRSTLGVLRDYGGADTAHVTAGESPDGIGLLEVTESDFPSLSFSVNSCLRLSTSACARASCFAGACAGAAARVCPVSSSSAVSAVVHAHATPMHGVHNSWSDTVRSQGPTVRRCTKGGVSGPAEDLRPVSEVEAGVNFRPAGWVRGQVAGSLPVRQPGTRTRTSKGSVDTPSLHPEVPDSLFVSPDQARESGNRWLDEGVWNHTIGDLGAKG